MGHECYKRGLLKEARYHFDEVLQEEPGHFWAQCLLAVCDITARPARLAEARLHLAACLQSHPELPWLFVLRGFAEGLLGADSRNSAEAEAHYRAADADFREALARLRRPLPLCTAGRSRHRAVQKQAIGRSARRP